MRTDAKTFGANIMYDTVYVANNGDNANEGDDIHKPLKTISNALRKGKNIMLESGDVFYENVVLNGQNIGRYGKGSKPLICGWKYLTNAKWERYDRNIWRLDLENSGYTGRVISDNEFLNDVGLIRSIDDGKIYGVKRQCVYEKDCIFKDANAQMNGWLKDEMNFAQVSSFGKGVLKGRDFRYLYLFSSKDPSKMHLTISTYGNGITACNATINGVAIEGFGCHGVAARSNTIIINCDIRYIGGSQQVSYKKWARFGNGIEFYISRITENGYAAYNEISRTFDCGTTIQGSDYVGAYPKNIVFEHNKIYNCRQAFEFFLNNNDKKTGEKFDCINCAFRKNICIDNGNNGFGTHEARDGQILSYQNYYVSSVRIEDNIFVGGPSFYIAVISGNLTFGQNIFYLTEGTFLWMPYGGKNPVIYKKNVDDRKINLDKVKLVFVSEKTLNKLRKKYIRMKL